MSFDGSLKFQFESGFLGSSGYAFGFPSKGTCQMFNLGDMSVVQVDEVFFPKALLNLVNLLDISSEN